MKRMKKIFPLVATVCLSAGLAAQEADDGFVVPLDEDFSKPVAQAAEQSAGGGNSGGSSSMKMGLWVEVLSDNVSLIRNVSDGTKKGYEFDNSHFTSEANWWFWGQINKSFTLDAEISVWDFDKTLYQENTYAGNVPDVTWGDGFQSLTEMPFSLIKNGNDDGVGAFNKLGLNLATSYIDMRFGYGNLKKGGMSEYVGIYNVIDRWDDVGDGYTELKNGSALREFGDFKIDALAAFSMMRTKYGMYDYLDVKWADKAEAALTFGSVTTEEKIFYYNRTNDNAFSAYLAATPIPQLKVEAHYLGRFGTDYDLGGDTGAFALRAGWTAETWGVRAKQSFAGIDANSVWGSDGTEYDNINRGTKTTQIDLWKSFEAGLPFTLGLDQGITLNSDELVDDEGLDEHLLFRSEPYADFDFSELAGRNLTLGAYGIFEFGKIAESVSADEDFVTRFQGAGLEVKSSGLAKYAKNVCLDYAVHNDYDGWTGGSSYALEKSFHSVMLSADITDRFAAHAGSIVRHSGGDDDTNVPFAFALGAKFKNVPLPGRPMLWAHFTYGMNPYEDNNYSIYRRDEALEKWEHRTYLMNTLDGDTNTSHISLGLIWDL